jgi:chemotaxis signal transduction protein
MADEEYLIARVHNLRLGIHCRDVKHVYTQRLTISRMVGQAHIFRGIANIDGEIVNLIDLRRRIGMRDAAETDVKTLIAFQTNLSSVYAVIVDEIIGMQKISESKLQQHQTNLNNANQNINLLFPMVACMQDDSLVHLLDSTYLEKTEAVEDAGSLEFF